MTHVSSIHQMLDVDPSSRQSEQSRCRFMRGVPSRNRPDPPRGSGQPAREEEVVSSELNILNCGGYRRV
jgi:hypothetical protein